MGQDISTPLCVHCSDPLDIDGRDLVTGEKCCGANPAADTHELPTRAAPRWSQVRLRILRILLNADAPVWALGMAEETGLSYGTVYGTFRQLYDLGWAVGITEHTHPGRPARVLYRPTTEGRVQLAALLGEGDLTMEAP